MRRLGVVALLALAGVVSSGCSGDDDASATPDPSVPVVVTFEVSGGERFRVLLSERDDVENAHGLLAGRNLPSIPNGLVVRGVTDVNEGYSWSLDPADFEWGAVTIEVCDGLPSDVEAGTVTSERYCPWSAVVVEVVPAT